MQLHAQPAKPAFADSARGLLQVRAPDVNVAVWRRPVPIPSIDRLRNAARAAPLANHVMVDRRRPETLRAVIEGVPDAAAAEAILADVGTLVGVFGEALREDRAFVRLESVRDDACRKLHADAVPLRLICTYAGPATEWVADEDAIRGNLRRVDVDMEAANASVLRRPDGLRRARPGDVLLLKGDAWPGFAGRGAVHRSPPLGPDAAPRLVLKIDPGTWWR
ncbi:MAG: DUF1826 domain-containing protein [Sandaracinaceae bacterium]